MNTLDMDKSHRRTGVRLEATQSSYTGYHVTLDDNGNYVSTTPVTGSHDYTNVLPSIQTGTPSTRTRTSASPTAWASRARTSGDARTCCSRTGG